jgi:hypothetical protein
MTDAGAMIQAKARTSLLPARVARVIVVVVAPALWLGIGSLRATALADDYFAQARGPGATVANVQIEGASPATR